MERTFIEWLCIIWDKYWTWFIRGTGTTLFIAVLGTMAGVVLGIIISVFFSSHTAKDTPKVLRWIYTFINILLKIYVKIFRGTPMLIQAVVLYYGLMEVWNINFNYIVVGVLVIALNTAAYMTETARAGIESVQNGQGQAADVLGLKNKDKMFKVFIPQAFINMIPNIGNELVSNIKDTSILNVISVSELFYVTKSIKGMIFRTYEPFLVASCIYLFLTTLVNRILRILEKKFHENLLREKKCQLSKKGSHIELTDYGVKNDAEAKPILEICHLYKKYNNKEVLKDINLSIEHGKVYAIVGTSGIGKTTLLKCIAQLEKFDFGTILYMGEMIDGNTDICGSQIGFVSQDYCLFKNLSVLENCTIGPICVKGIAAEEARRIAEYYLEKLNMLEYCGYKPEILSGGQAQRVAIARALSMQPRLLLFDEPTSALDPELRCDIIKLINSLTALDVTVVIVTHDMEFARYTSDIVIHIADGEIEEMDTTMNLFNTPKSPKTKAFLRRVELAQREKGIVYE